jgi:hypothetical protein
MDALFATQKDHLLGKVSKSVNYKWEASKASKQAKESTWEFYI